MKPTAKGRCFASIFLIVIAVLFSSCGKKGSPKPPDLSAPDKARSFSAAVDREGVLLTWQSPTSDASGEELRDLAKFFIRRSNYEKDVPPEFETIGEIVPAGAGSGGDLEVEERKYQYRDTTALQGRRYDYVIVSAASDGTEGQPTPVIRVTLSGAASTVQRF